MPNYKRLTPFKRCVLQNFPFIEADFDALTNYGLLCKIVEYLNNVISSQNEVQANVEALNNAFNELKNYVDNFFDNLDVQDEIDNKLDEMAENGSLGLLIKDYTIDTTYYFDTIYSPMEDTHMQGACVLPDGNIVQFNGDGTVRKYSTDGSVLLSNTANYGHCNSACYCSKTGTIFVEEHANTSDGTVTMAKIHEIDPATLNLITTHVIDNDAFPSYLYGMVYDEENEQFIFTNWWGNMVSYAQYSWKTDMEFNLIAGSVKTHDLNIKSIAYVGKFGKYIGVVETGSNNVYLYDYGMNFIKQTNIYRIIGDVWNITELEWIDTMNGNIYLGSACGMSGTPNRGASLVFGKCDPSKNYEIIHNYDGDLQPTRETYHVNHQNNTDIYRNGTTSHPFRSIPEAINASLRIKNKLGSVRIFVHDAPASADEKYFLIFSENKAYSINTPSNTTITYLTGIAVDKKCKVVFNNSITIDPLETKQNPFSFGSGGDLCIMGNLVVSGEIGTSDNSKVVLNGYDGAYIRAMISQYGINVSDYWGVFENTSRQTRNISSITDIIEGLNYSDYNVTRQIRGLKLRANVSGSFQLPYLSQNMTCVARFYTTNSSDKYEIQIPYSYGMYQKIPFFEDATSRYIEISNTMLLSATNVTVDRVAILS